MSEQTLVQKLRSLAVEYRCNLKAIGSILLQLEELGQPAEFYAQTILRDEFGVPASTGIVAFRWARGDLGTDEEAQLLLGLVPHSALAQWSETTIRQVLTEKHRIVSRDEKRVVVKPLAEMTRREVTANIGRQGFKPIGEQRKTVPTFRFCQARAYEIDDGIGIVYIATGAAEGIRMHVGRKLHEQAAADLAARKTSKTA